MRALCSYLLLLAPAPRLPSSSLVAIFVHFYTLYLIARNGITCGQPIIKRLMRTYIIITVLLLPLLLLLLLLLL